MLASTAGSVADAIATVAGEASVEFKLDGARIQVHRNGESVRVFTRNLADITHRVPEIVEAVRALPVDDVILDGETLSLDADGGPRPFQDTMARFGSETISATALRPWFFDVLHIDGTRPDRRAAPRAAGRAASASRRSGASRASSRPTPPPQSSCRAMPSPPVTRAWSSRPSTLSYAAGRRGKSWIKVKPVLTYDLVVLAVEWGSGRRTGQLSNLHLGALDPGGRVRCAGRIRDGRQDLQGSDR